MTGCPPDDAEQSANRPAGFDDYELRLGDIMRGERATLGISLLDVQRDIKINAKYLAAIEDADLAAFETPGFIAGYIRAYSKHLGLNPDWAFRTFCAETGFSHVAGINAQIHARGPRPGAAPPARRTAPGGEDLFARSPIYAAPRESIFADINPGMLGSFAVLILLTCALGYGGWSVLREIQQVEIAPVETALGTTAPDDALTGGPMAEASAEPPRMDQIDRLFRPEVLDVPVVVARDGPISSLDPREQGAYAVVMPGRGLEPETPSPPDTARVAEAPAPGDRATPEIPDENAVAVQVTAEGPPEVVLFAREPVWVRVRSADGTVLLEKILDGGERYVLPSTEAPPVLRAGNSGSLYFAVNGQTLGPAGPGTSIARDVPLGATELVARYALVDLAADPELSRLAALVVTPPLAGPAATQDQPGTIAQD